MVEFWLDSRRLMDLGRMLHLPVRQVSDNYLVHCAFSELFQHQAPTVFCIENSHKTQENLGNTTGRLLRILCYSSIDAEALKLLAQGFASPALYEIIKWDRASCKPMPLEYPSGLRFRYELRTPPVIRKASEGIRWHKGQELDVFLSRVWETNNSAVKINREVVYKEWLHDLFERNKGASLETVQILRFSLERMSRRNHELARKLRVIQRPDVTFTGILKVEDSEAFKMILSSGVGRHKSFGYGMLKIRRP